MNWLNLDSGSSAHCVYAQRGVDRFYISLLPPAGDLISAGLAGHLSSCTSLHWFSCTFPSHTPLLRSSNKLPGSIPRWRNLISLFPGATLQDLSRKHQECTRGKPRERRTRNSKWCLAETRRRGSQRWCWASRTEEKEVRSFLIVTKCILMLAQRLFVRPRWSYLWPPSLPPFLLMFSHWTDPLGSSFECSCAFIFSSLPG